MATRERTKRTAPAIGDAEEARLRVAIAADPDAAELTDAELARLRPAHEVLPPAVCAAPTRGGRPRAETGSVQLTLRVDAAVLAADKAGGPGWEARMNAALAEGIVRDAGRPEGGGPA